MTPTPGGVGMGGVAVLPGPGGWVVGQLSSGMTLVLRFRVGDRLESISMTRCKGEGLPALFESPGYMPGLVYTV